MSDPKISVIIPVYNTVSYLKECMDSVLNQSFKNIEVICVNDGSTDNSLELLEDYQIHDERIIIINQPKKGLGAARNIAMNKAKGEYILFLDSDDYIKEDAFVDLYDVMSSKDLDLLMFKILNFDDETYDESKSSYFEMNFLKKIVGNNVFTWTMIQNRIFDMSVTAPGKMFKRNLIKNISFPEGVIFEDNLFFIKIIFKAKRIYFLDNYFYYRRLRTNSITNSYFEYFTDCIYIYDKIGDYLKEIGKYSLFSEQLFNRKCTDVYTRFSKVPEEFKEDFFNDIKENFTKQKRRLEKEGTLKFCTERSLAIFNSSITSQTYREFELSINLFDLKRNYDKLKLNMDNNKKHYEKLLAKSKKSDKKHLKEINELKNSTSWRMTRIFRKIVDYINTKIN